MHLRWNVHFQVQVSVYLRLSLSLFVYVFWSSSRMRSIFLVLSWLHRCTLQQLKKTDNGSKNFNFKNTQTKASCFFVWEIPKTKQKDRSIQPFSLSVFSWGVLRPFLHRLHFCSGCKMIYWLLDVIIIASVHNRSAQTVSSIIIAIVVRTDW